MIEYYYHTIHYNIIDETKFTLNRILDVFLLKINKVAGFD